MTSNITRFVMDVGTVLLGPDREQMANARHRAQHAWPAIVGFAAGYAFGAICQAAIGLQSLVLPVGLALLALVISASPRSGGHR